MKQMFFTCSLLEILDLSSFKADNTDITDNFNEFKNLKSCDFQNNQIEEAITV